MDTSLAPATASTATTATPQALSFANGEQYSASGEGLNTQAKSALSNLGFTGNTYSNYVTPQASTTTISNQNKINQVPGIVDTTNTLAKTGVTTDAQGNATYANGTLVPQTDTTTASSAAPNLTNKTGLSTGGYVGDVYYAPGSQLPVGPDGKAMQTTETSPTDDQILSNLNQLKSTNDSITASIIDSIHAQYNQLRQAQETTNTGTQATTNNALLMGGVTGKGSSAQYAPISSVGIMQSEMSYGLSKLSDLTNQENMAVIQAQQAGQQNDFQLMDKLNNQIASIRDEKVAAATKLNDQIAAQNQKIADEQQQATKDTAVTNLYQSGTTDPGAILKQLNASGLTITSSEINNVVSGLKANQQDIDNIALDAAGKGADSATLQAIQNAKSPIEAMQVEAQFAKQQNNVQLAQAQNVATPVTNNNGEFFNSKTGQVYPTPEAFFAAYGIKSFQEAYQKDLVTDVKPAVDLSKYPTSYQEYILAQQGGYTGSYNDYQDMDANRKAVRSTTNNVSYTQTKDQLLSADIAQTGANLKSVIGNDTFVSPQDWKRAYGDWIAAGHSGEDFTNAFKGYVNPADPNDYGVKL